MSVKIKHAETCRRFDMFLVVLERSNINHEKLTNQIEMLPQGRKNQCCCLYSTRTERVENTACTPRPETRPSQLVTFIVTIVDFQFAA